MTELAIVYWVGVMPNSLKLPLLVCSLLLLLIILLLPTINQLYAFHSAKKLYLHINDSSSFSLAQSRLDLFVAELTIYPRFSLSAVDLDNLSIVIESLRENADFFANLFESDTDQQLIRDALYPLDFLEAIREAEFKRRTLIEQPSKQNAYEYLDTLERTISKYIAYIDTVTPLYVSSEKPKRGLIDGTSTADDYIVWLDELKQSALLTQDWVDTKRSCLERYRFDCMTPVPSLKSTANEFSATAFTINKNDVAVVRHFAEAEPELVRGEASDSYHAAPVIVHDARCTLYGAAEQAFVWWDKASFDAIPYVRFTYIDELLFMDYTMADNPQSKRFVELGIPYQYQPVNYYTCMQFGFDSADLTTYYAVWNYLQNTTLFSSTENAIPAPESLAHLEAEIRESSDVLDSRLITAYLSESESYLKSHPQVFTTAQKNSLQKLILLYRDKSRYFADTLANIYHVSGYIRREPTLIQSPSAEDFIAIQSAHSLTLLPFNQTVILENTTPVKQYGANYGYATYLKQMQTDDGDMLDMLTYISNLYRVE